MPGIPGSTLGRNRRGRSICWPGVWARMGIYKGFAAQEQDTSACAYIQASSPMSETLTPRGHTCALPQGPTPPMGHKQTGHSAHTGCPCAHQAVLEQNAGTRSCSPGWPTLAQTTTSCLQALCTPGELAHTPRESF